MKPLLAALLLLAFVARAAAVEPAETPRPLSIAWADNWLTIRGGRLADRQVRVHYLEAYCRPGAHNQNWPQRTKMRHTTELLRASDDGQRIELRCTLDDGLTVQHVITAAADEVDFCLTAHNPTEHASQAQWAQPCVRVDELTGRGKLDYIPLCFLFVDGKLTRLPTQPWAEQALYMPGQVYCPPHVSPDDVNPRPLSSVVPSNALMGCYSHDGRTMLATAWEPYHELFQGVATCIHCDFRLGNLQPGQTRQLKGKIYIVPADEQALLERYERDFSEHAKE